MEGQPSLLSIVPEVGVNRDFSLKGHTQKSPTLPDPGQKQQFGLRLGKNYLLILESLPEKQKETNTHPGDIDSSRGHF